MRQLLTAFAAASLVAAVPALAAPCKDAKGKFIKCPPVKKGPCKDKAGKFVKCGTHGTR